MLDRIDRLILTELQADGSLSVSELADRLGMTPPPCWRRVKRLKDEGYLTRLAWLVDADKLGLSVIVYATVKLATHDRNATNAFREQVGQFPEVQECYILLGGIDVLLKIRTASIKAYESFFYERLSQLPSVREVTSSVVLSEVKCTTALPIDMSS